MIELTEQEQETIKDYILLMLGAPVLKIELDDKQLKFATAEAVEHVAHRVRDNLDEHGRRKFLAVVKQGAYIKAKHILGRIRSKFKNGGPLDMKLDGELLLKESKEELKDWHLLVEHAYPVA